MHLITPTNTRLYDSKHLFVKQEVLVRNFKNV